MTLRRCAALLLSLALIATVAAQGASARTAATPTVKLALKSTPKGKILVTNGGLIVYMFTKDKNHKNNCPASNGCAPVWPPLTGKVSLGPGLKKSLLGTVKDGKVTQITYAGWPLYGWEYNSSDTGYVGFVQYGGAWDALTASGKVVK